MADLRRHGKNEQKKGVCVASAELTFSEIVDNSDNINGALIVTLPSQSVITDVTIIERTPANAGATCDIVVGTTTLVNEGPLDSSNKPTVILNDFSTGGDIIVREGATAPTQGTFLVLIEYIEYVKSINEYTTVQ